MKMKADYARIIAGVFILLVGVYLLAANFFNVLIVDWGIIWPIFLLIPGFGLFLEWLSSDERGKKSSLLIPSTILILLGLNFLANMTLSLRFNFHGFWAFSSFIYTGSVALGLYFAWYFSESRNGDLLVASKILAIISGVVFLLSNSILFSVMFNPLKGVLNF
ncbi:MAG TPA: hypothetical protein ENN64_01010, partial [bacterium]|nr:hypothetical protein [bacterium]